MKNFTTQIRDLLLERGADLVGFCDVSDIGEAGFPFGISIGVRVPEHIVREIGDGPTAAYHRAYHDINTQLDALVCEGAEWLTAAGFAAHGITRENVITMPGNRTRLPHKTLAVRSALGWIGKNNLLITPQYGGAIRLSSLLTDAPLTPAGDLMESLCGACEICRLACPARAIYGNHWHPESDRDDLFQMERCEATADRLCEERFGVPDAGICGICFAQCPFTLRYVNGEGIREK